MPRPGRTEEKAFPLAVGRRMPREATLYRDGWNEWTVRRVGQDPPGHNRHENRRYQDSQKHEPLQGLLLLWPERYQGTHVVARARQPCGRSGRDPEWEGAPQATEPRGRSGTRPSGKQGDSHCPDSTPASSPLSSQLTAVRSNTETQRF